jgi:NADH dehydrogenase
LRYVTDLGRSGAVITEGWDRQVRKTGREGKGVKRLVNMQVIYPPADGTAEALLTYSGASLDERQEGLKIMAKVA